MAITNITISQNNMVGDCDLLNIASPLIYLVNVEYTDAVPDLIYATIFSGATELDHFKCLPFKDISSTVRQFWFRADEILREHIPPLEDVTQSDNTLIEISGAVKDLTIRFSDLYPTPINSGFTNFFAINAAAQFGGIEANQDVYNNEQQSQIGISGKHAYAYFYSADPTGTLSVTESGGSNYEMVATTEGEVTGLTASKVSDSVVKYELATIGTGDVDFDATGVFETISIKVNEILGTFSDANNKVELTYLNNGTVTVDLDALGVGIHTFNLNTAFTTSNVKIFIVGDIAETKSISLDFIRLTSIETTC